MNRFVFRLFAAVATALLVGACGGPIDPERPPIYDYEFESMHDQEVIVVPDKN